MKNNIGPVYKPLFYRSSPKNTVPVRPVDVISWFHPHVRFHGYVPGSKDCKVKATQGLPFFADNFGPKWTEFTTTAHEQLPGHHLEVGAFQRSPTNWLNFSKGENMVGALHSPPGDKSSPVPKTSSRLRSRSSVFSFLVSLKMHWYGRENSCFWSI